MATTRLRKTFKYPDDADSENSPEELDEQEQEALITKLRKDNEAQNSKFGLLFTLLPLPCTFPFLIYMFTGSANIRTSTQLWLCFLGVTSLLSTAYLSHVIPTSSSRTQNPHPRALQLEDEGPVQKYLPYLNGGVCLLLALAALAFKGKGEPGTMAEIFWIWCLVPGGMSLVISIAKRSMMDVDIQGLEQLKYDYKGA